MNKVKPKLRLVTAQLLEKRKDCSLEEFAQVLRDIIRNMPRNKINPALQDALDNGMKVPLLVDSVNGKIGVQLDNVISLPRRS